jgi:signal transduction histidine kinase/ligand-binding sensor domain-containing protein
MKKPTRTNLAYLLLILAILCVQACNNSKDAPPFPSLNSEFKQPITKSFEFSKTDTIQWTTVDKSKIKPLPVKSFSWDKLPSKAFNISVPYPLKAPLTQQSLDWNNLPETDFDFNSLPQAKITIKTTALGKPKIIKAGLPINMPNASRGVMQLDANFGLPNIPKCVFKDRYGMLWMGTDHGIARYDSENLEFYGEEQGLNSKMNFAMLLDSKGRLWIGDNGKTVSVIDFKAQLVLELSTSFDLGIEYNMIEAADGKIWLTNNRAGYNIIDLEAKIIRKLDDKHGLLGNFSITPLQDKEGLIWLSTGKGLTIIDLKKGKNKSLTVKDGLLSTFVFGSYQDREGRIWIGIGDGGVQIINRDKTTISQLSGAQGLNDSISVSAIYQDKIGKMWLGTNNGLLYSFNESKKELEKFYIDKAGQIIFKITEDQQGQIWTAIVQGGLHKLDPKNGRPGNYGLADGLTSNEVWATLEAKDGKIWIGTYNGIDVYDPKTQSLKHLGIEQGLVNARTSSLVQDSRGRIWACGSATGISVIDPKKGTIQQLTTKQGLFSDRIKTILEDKNGIFWLGGEVGTLQTIDLEHSIFKYYEAKTEETKVWNNTLLLDASNNIWVGTRGAGIQRIDPTNNTRSQLTQNEGLVSNDISSLLLDADQNIWTATSKGVVLINSQKKELTTFTPNEGLAANDVYALIERKGKMYNGTSKGLTILEQLKQKNAKHPFWKVKTLGKKQGLDQIDFSENSFTFDKNGRLWAGVLGTMLTVIDPIQEGINEKKTFITGLNILDKKQEFVDKILMQKGRENLEKTFKSAKDTLLFSKTKLENAEDNMHWSAVEGPYNLAVDLVLPADKNYLNFNYNGLQYSNPDKLLYSYFLEGIDKQWSPISEKTTTENYRDLPPGDYNFKVCSKGFDGIWSKPAEFKFTIATPWWQTWWAYLFYFIVFGGFIRAYVLYRAKNLKRENTILEEKVALRTQQLTKSIEDLKATQSQLIQSEKMASLGELTAGIAHEIQNPLNFVNNFSEVSMELIEEMQTEIVKGDINEANLIANDIKNNLEKINYHGKRADSIVKGMLQHSRTGSLTKEPTDINKLADEYLRLAYHGLRAKDKSFNAELVTNFDPSIPKITILGQDVGRVFLNMFTNAFYATHQMQKQSDSTYKPTLTVTTNQNENYIEIIVKDNGIGIPDNIKDKILQPFFTTKPTGEGTGLGLSLSYDIIVKSHDGKIIIDSKEKEYTIFVIQIPIK